MNNPFSIIQEHRLVAILRLKDLSDAVPLATTLVRSGVMALEFTLTNQDAPKAIEQCLDQVPEFRGGIATIGMGSVRTLEEARIAMDAGSQFIVSPITSIPIIEACKRASVSVCPGAYTPTEIAAAHDAGADIVKVFPARNLGPAYIQDVLAPMPYLRLMPTGGIDLGNVENYFRAGAFAVGVGGQFVDVSAIQNRDWDIVSQKASAFAEACRRHP